MISSELSAVRIWSLLCSIGKMFYSSVKGILIGQFMCSILCAQFRLSSQFSVNVNSVSGTWHIFYLFICNLFNNALSNSDLRALSDRMMINWKGCERKQLWPDLKALAQHLLVETEKKHDISQCVMYVVAIIQIWHLPSVVGIQLLYVLLNGETVPQLTAGD
jgi:hypothetical protein